MKETHTNKSRSKRGRAQKIAKRLQGCAEALAVPLLLCTLVFVVTALAGITAGYDPLRPNSYSRWDSGHYIRIAEEGYHPIPCGTLPPGPDNFCVNAAWFPGYSILMRLGQWAGLPIETAGVLISFAFLFGIFFVLWNCFFRRKWSLHTVLALLFAAVFPGGIYYEAIFPLSMTVFFILLALLLYDRKLYLCTGISCFLATFSYSGTAPVALAFSLVPLLYFSGSWRKRFLRSFLLGAWSAMGVMAVFVWHQIALGDWRAFFRTEFRYHQGIHNPIPHYLDLIRQGVALHLNPTDAQTLFILCVLVLIVITFLVVPKRFSRHDLLPFFTTGALWIVPIIQGAGLSMYRAESLLLPVVLLSRKLPAWIQLVIFFVAMDLRYSLTILFFRGNIV